MIIFLFQRRNQEECRSYISRSSWAKVVEGEKPTFGYGQFYQLVLIKEMYNLLCMKFRLYGPCIYPEA